MVLGSAGTQEHSEQGEQTGVQQFAQQFMQEGHCRLLVVPQLKVALKISAIKLSIHLRIKNGARARESP